MHERRSHDRSLRSHEESTAHRASELLDQAQPPKGTDFESRRQYYAAQLDKELDAASDGEEAAQSPEATQELGSSRPSRARPTVSGRGQREGRGGAHAGDDSGLDSFRDQVLQATEPSKRSSTFTATLICLSWTSLEQCPEIMLLVVSYP